MIRYITLALLAGTIAFSVSCGSKKKNPDAPAQVDGAIDDRNMQFDPLGSDSGNIQGLSTVNFEYDRANLTTEARRQLAANADWIKGNSKVTVQIEGHCDSRGSVEYNLALGERRAKSVKDYLVSLGVEGQRLTIISYGKEKPIAQGDSESAHASNRRANFVPLPN